MDSKVRHKVLVSVQEYHDNSIIHVLECDKFEVHSVESAEFPGYILLEATVVDGDKVSNFEEVERFEILESYRVYKTI